MDLPLILSLVSTTAVVLSVLFAGIQVRNVRLQRSREAALLLARSFQTPEFMRALLVVEDLPGGLNREQLERRGDGSLEVVTYWLGTMESIGALVHGREIGLATAEDFFSGPILISWRKLQPYVEERRQKFDRDTMYEWFQWLAERIGERETGQKPVPAFVEFRDWKE